MKGYKAIELLKTFSTEDLDDLGRFIRSEYFSGNSKVQKLFELVRGLLKDIDRQEFDEEWLYSKMNPGKEFRKETIRKLFHGLTAVIEKYISIKNFESKPFEFSDNLFDGYLKRNLQRYGKKCIDNCDELLESELSLNSDYYLYGFKNANNKCNLLLTTTAHNSADTVDKMVEAISERGHNIAGFFVKEMIRCLDNLLAFDKNFNLNKERYFVWNIFKTLDMPAMIEAIKLNAKSPKEHAVCEVYGAMYLAFSEFDVDSNYWNYRRLINRHAKLFSHDEIRFHTLRKMRYCLMKIAESKNSSKYETELFDIYREFLDKGLYRSSLTEYLTVEAFRPILNLGLKLKKYKWTLEFINTYKSKLPPERRVNMFHYASALYHFHTGRHAESMKHSQKVEFDHFLFKLDLRDLMLMTLFELRATENAYSQIDSYRFFLRKDKTISESEKRRHKVFVDIVRKMLEYFDSPDDSKLIKLKALLTQEHSNKEWVSEKAEMILGGKKRTA